MYLPLTWTTFKSKLSLRDTVFTLLELILCFLGYVLCFIVLCSISVHVKVLQSEKGLAKGRLSPPEDTPPTLPENA